MWTWSLQGHGAKESVLTQLEAQICQATDDESIAQFSAAKSAAVAKIQALPAKVHVVVGISGHATESYPTVQWAPASGPNAGKLVDA